MAISITRHFGGTEDEYPIYSKDEADSVGIEYVDWKRAREGLWVLTDDGYVGECIRVRSYRQDGRVSYCFTFSFARKWLSRNRNTGHVVGNPELHFEEYHEKQAYAATAPRTWIEREADKRRTRRAVNLYATLFIANEGRLSDEEWDLIGQSYRPDQETPRATVKRLFRHQQIQEMAQQQVANLHEEAGVTKETVVRNFEKLREEAMSDGSYNTAFRVLEKQAEMLGLDEDFDQGGLPAGDGQPGEVEAENVEILDQMEEDLAEDEDE